MPALSCFIDEQDVSLLVERLNADPEIAIIVADGPRSVQEAYRDRLDATMNSLQGTAGEGAQVSFYGLIDNGYRQRWKAVPMVLGLADGEHALWHVPAGSLPLLNEGGSQKEIPDPWTGWVEQRSGADPTVPYFGAGHHAAIRLSLWTRHRSYTNQEKVALSVVNSFWDREEDMLVVSDFQWIGGRYGPPPPETRRWWSRLRAWLDRAATRVADPPQILWAFPSARQKLESGMAYYARGWQVNCR
jgi:hypothetical protein